MIKDIYPNAPGSNPDNLRYLLGRLFFFATDDTHGNELWVSNGTTAGTTLVKDICVGTCSGID